MELKTSISIPSGNMGDKMRFEKFVGCAHLPPISLIVYHRKLLKFYFQSFLLGVPVRDSFSAGWTLSSRPLFSRKSLSDSAVPRDISKPLSHSAPWIYLVWSAESQVPGTLRFVYRGVTTSLTSFGRTRDMIQIPMKRRFGEFPSGRTLDYR